MLKSIKQKVLEGKRHVTIMLIAAFAFFVFALIQMLYFYPMIKLNRQVRDIETVKEIIDSNENVEIEISFYGSEYSYMLEGYCKKVYNCDSGWCYMDFETYDKVLDIENCMIDLDGREGNYSTTHISTEFNDYIRKIEGDKFQVSFLYITPSSGFVGSYVSENRFFSFDNNGRYVHLFEERCTYYPGNILKTTCIHRDIIKAKELLNAYYGLLEDIGVSEAELKEYIKWYKEEFQRKYIDSLND